MYVFWALFPILTTARDFEMVDWRSLPFDEFKPKDQIISEDFTSINATELRPTRHWELLKQSVSAMFISMNETMEEQLTSMGSMNIPDMVFEEVKCTNGTLYLLPSTLRSGPRYVMSLKFPTWTTYAFMEIGDVRFEYSQCEGGQFKDGLNGTLESNRIYWQMTYRRNLLPCRTVVDKFKFWSGNFTWGDDDASAYQFNDMEGIQWLERYMVQTFVPQYQRIFENEMKQRLIPRIFPCKDYLGSPVPWICIKFRDF